MMRTKMYLALIIVVLYSFGSCMNKKGEIDTGSVLRIDTAPGACPYITKDIHGNPVISWVKLLNDTAAVFCYAVSTDNGQSFGDPIVISSSHNIHPHAENIPKVLFKPSGEIIAVWGAANVHPKNPYAGLVYYAQSFDNGKTWTVAKNLVADTAGYDQRYFDVALQPGGEAAIIWLDNRKRSSKDGSALYFATTQGGNGFMNERLVSSPCCECCRTVMKIDKDSRIHLLYRAIINDSIRDMVYMFSKDGGNTFSSQKRISIDDWVINTCPHSGPSMTTTDNGIHFAWFTGGNPAGIYYTRSNDYGNSFLKRDSVTVKGKHPQIAGSTGNTLLTVWDEPLMKNNQLFSKIMIELRDQQGSCIARQAITSDSVHAHYPVLQNVGDHTTLIAYDEGEKNEKRVYYQRVTIER